MHVSRVIFKTSDITKYFARNYKRFPHIATEKNLRYGNEAKEARYNRADVLYDKRLMKSGAKFPVFVNIHGGGFVGGDKKHRGGICRLIASHGFFVYNVNYRLYHKYPSPAGTMDVLTALNLLPAIADKYHLDLDRVVLSGDSAGGYLAAHALASMHDEHLRSALCLPVCNVKIKAAMLFCGLYDFDIVLEKKAPFGMTDDLGSCITGLDLKKNKALLYTYPLRKELSPINFVNENWPEIFITSAKHDAFCGGQGEALEKVMAERNVKFTAYHGYDNGENHCWHISLYKKSSKLFYPEMFKFMDKIL
jgi:acetyl esterase/lipase